jgi:hypothetical protein
MMPKEITFKILSVISVGVGLWIGPPRFIAFDNWQTTQLALIEIGLVAAGILLWTISKKGN